MSEMYEVMELMLIEIRLFCYAEVAMHKDRMG